MNFQDASNLRIPEGYVRTIHDKDGRLLWGSVGYDVSFDGNATQGPLPSQYRQVEYVEATGTQYVNTGVRIASAGAQWSATIDIQYTASSSSSQIMLGTGTGAGGWAGQNGGFYALGPTDRTTYASTQRVQAYLAFGTSASITIESETITRAGSVPDGSVYLLAAAIREFACEAKLYSCKIYDASNVLVRDFVPCVRKSDSVAGLYDMVNMAFYVSNGADAFIAGGNVPSPDHPQEIQTVTGEQTVKITDGGEESQEYTVNLGSIELCKIGTYKDRIYKADSKWYVEKQVGKVVLDGSESYTYNPNYGGFRYQNANFNISSANPSEDLICSHFTVATMRGALPTAPIIKTYNSTSDSTYIFICDGTSDVDAFKSWLAAHNTTVYYALATPTTTEITDTTLIAQLVAIYDWIRRYGYNAIVTTPGDNLPIVIDRTPL